MLKELGMAFARGVAYTLAFVFVYFVGQLLITTQGYKSVDTNHADARAEKQWAAYEAQQKKTETLLDRSDRYYDRMEANATKEEELNKRFEALIARWEKQNVPKKP